MFMQKIRRMTKKNKKGLIVVVALLTIGLVGSFALWNSNDYSSSADSDTMTYAQQAAAYEAYIEGILPDTVDAADYETAYKIALSYADLQTLYLQAYSENAYSEDSDATEEDLSAYQEGAFNASAQAAVYFQQAIDNAPETVEDPAMGQLYTYLGSQLLYSNDMTGAGDAFSAALELSPDNVNTVSAYAEYLCYTLGYDVAVSYLGTELANFDENSSEYSTLSNQQAQYEYLAELFASQETDETTTDDGTGDTTSEDTGTEEAE